MPDDKNQLGEEISIKGESVTFSPLTVPPTSDKSLPRFPQRKFATEEEIAKVKAIDPKKAPKGEYGKRGMGKKTLWNTVVYPHLGKICDLYSRGATLAQIALFFNISVRTLSRMAKENLELRNALQDARDTQEKTLIGKLMELATGATRVRVVNRARLDKVSGRLVKLDEAPLQVERTVLEPNITAIRTLLGRFHGWNVDLHVQNDLALKDEKQLAEERRIAKEAWDKTVEEQFGIKLSEKPRSQTPRKQSFMVEDSDLDALGA